MFFAAAALSFAHISDTGTPRSRHNHLCSMPVLLPGTGVFPCFAASRAARIAVRRGEVGSAVKAAVLHLPGHDDRQLLFGAATGAGHRVVVLVDHVPELDVAARAQGVLPVHGHGNVCHLTPPFHMPITSRTCAMVSLKRGSARRRPSSSTSCTMPGRWASSILRSRNSASSPFTALASACLHSRQPIPAVSHPCLAQAMVSPALTCSCSRKMAHLSGLPGSFRRILWGSCGAA